MDTISIMKNRRSTRTYQERAITKEHWSRITEELAALSAEHGVRLSIVKNNFHGKKFGTYGVIKNPDAYLVCVCKKDRDLLLQAGMALEKAILCCTELGIGTCWLGGTFKRGEFGTQLQLDSDEVIPAVVSAGYPENSEGFIGRMVRKGAKSATRIPFEELFFENDFSHSIPFDDDAAIALEMVRMGPSASNKQPWRIVRKDRNYHLFLEHTPGYGKGFAFDIQLLDMGIAMAHFSLAMEQLGKKGTWRSLGQPIPNLADGVEYIKSFVAEET